MALAHAIENKVEAETFARKPFQSHAALKTDSITHLYNINSFFPCVFASPDSEIIFRAKVSGCLSTWRSIRQAAQNDTGMGELFG